MSTQINKAKTSRRAQQREQAHRRSIAQLRDLVADVYNAEQDGLLYCGSVHLANRRTPWMQLTPGMLALWWPYSESPHVVLFRDVPCTLRVRVRDWSDEGGFALISYAGEPTAVAAWLDLVIQNVYNCKPGYTVDCELQDLAEPET